MARRNLPDGEPAQDLGGALKMKLWIVAAVSTLRLPSTAALRVPSAVVSRRALGELASAAALATGGVRAPIWSGEIELTTSLSAGIGGAAPGASELVDMPREAVLCVSVSVERRLPYVPS